MTNTKPKLTGVGIDFGTTNSVVAITTGDASRLRTLALLNRGDPHPSVIWYQPNHDPIVGSDAKNNVFQFADTPGHFFVSSIKTRIGHDDTISIFSKKSPISKVASEIFLHLKKDAEETHNVEFKEAVVTIPVDFDGRARRELRRAANLAGIHIKSFVYEPSAAAIAHFYKPNYPLAERDGETVLVFDWGGGTLDITVTRIVNGVVTDMAAEGVANQSGDYFDEKVRNYVLSAFRDLHKLPPDQLRLRAGVEDRLRAECETAKKELSTEEDYELALASFCRWNDRMLNLKQPLSRAEFENLIDATVMDAMAKVDLLLKKCRLHRSDIDLALMIGGTSKIPKVYKEMHDRFGAKLQCPNNPASIIAEGAAIVDGLGLQPVLARTIAVELSDGSSYAVLSSGEVVKPESCVREVTFYCTDNRDGQARLVVKESTQSDPSRYVTKLVLPIPVSADLPKPYNHERVVVQFEIDQDLILHITAKAATQQQPVHTEVYDLCFALKSS